jgi:uncharacterized integral membrane protein
MIYGKWVKRRGLISTMPIDCNNIKPAILTIVYTIISVTCLITIFIRYGTGKRAKEAVTKADMWPLILLSLGSFIFGALSVVSERS